MFPASELGAAQGISKEHLREQEPSCEDMSTANVSGTSGPYNGRASEPWRSYSGMLYSGAVDSKTVGEIVTYNQNHSKLSHLGIWSGVRRTVIAGTSPELHSSKCKQSSCAGRLAASETSLCPSRSKATATASFNTILLASSCCSSTLRCKLSRYRCHLGCILLKMAVDIVVDRAHDCTRGTWTCFESRGIPDWTPAGGYTTPSQSIVPLHAKCKPHDHLIFPVAFRSLSVSERFVRGQGCLFGRTR